MEDKLAVARRWVELYNERSDVAEFVSLLDPEVELQTPGGPRLHGHDQARDWFEREPENVQARIIPGRFIDGGDVVVGLGKIEVRWIAALIWFRDGKIVRWQPFETHAAALDAAGLSA